MKRRKFIYQTSLLGGLLPVAQQLSAFDIPAGPFFATGIKIGEITPTSAIVWARLTKNNKPVGKTAPVPKAFYLDNDEWHPVTYFKEKYKQYRPDRPAKIQFPAGYDTSNIEGAVPGTNGEIRLMYKPVNTSSWLQTNWQKVNEAADFSTHIKLNDLQPGTAYEIIVEGREGIGKKQTVIKGKFTTAAHASMAADVHFMVTTCHEYNDQDDAGGFKIYKHMQALSPHFMVHTGDVLYYDQLAKNIPLAHWHWQRMFGLANCIEYYRNVPCYFMKDDHDTWMNDCYPQSKNQFMGELTFSQGVQIFNQQVPMSEKPYRSFRWGKDVQVWLVEGREYRDNNLMEDGPAKSIWGKEQMEWFQSTFSASDATFRILISATPVVGPDRPQKRDNHANSGFAYEGNVIRSFLATQKNVFVVCGDRHWQYVSQDSKTGLMEFSCGPASDEHAGGWKKEDVLPAHHYLNIAGGFLSVDVKRQQDIATITFTHYSVNGEKLYSKNYQSKQG